MREFYLRPLQLRDGFSRFILSGGQLALIMLGFQIEHPLGWVGVAVAIALLSVWGWMGAVRRWRAMTDMPTSQIASAAQGYVELHGRGRGLAGLPLVSPLNGLPCLWYRYTIEHKDNDGKWSHYRTEVSDASFILRDDSGECLIDPEHAEIVSKRKDIWEENDERYTQWLLLQDEMIYVLGQFRTRSGLDLALDRDGDIKALLAEWKQSPQGLLERFDLDGNGEIDLREWELARSAARREVESQHRETRNSADLHQMHYPDDGRLYLITNLIPEKLARRYQWWAWAHLCIFFGALAGSGYAWRDYLLL